MIHVVVPGVPTLPLLEGYTPELPYAEQFLHCTEEFFMIPVYTGDEQWYCQPTDIDDARGSRRCAKSGLMVPKHAQVIFDGRVYGARYAPVSKPSWFR